MQIKRVTIAVATAAALLATPMGAPTTASASDAAGTATVARVADTQQARDRDRFKVAPGVTFNVPGDQRMNNKVLRAIAHSPKGSKIRAMTWNFNSWVFVNALRNAHQRGVSVRIIMARSLANEQGPNGPYAQLKRALGAGNAKRKPGLRSWFRTCSNSCRGKGGAMHSKMYLFSNSGRTEHIVMSSSANMTGSAASVQFNDMYTITNQRPPYRVSMKVFNEAGRDKPAKVRRYQHGNIMGWFHPNRGKDDIPYTMLGKVRCHGAKGAGINGRTSIRIAQDVFNGHRGAKIARRIKQLHNEGCNIRVVYSQLGRSSFDILQGVPLNHLVKDSDGDGAYDVYLHMKAMAISGHYAGKPNARIVFNGSANWSGLGLIADEQGLVIESERVERLYGEQINRLFRTHLRSARPLPARMRVADPYMKMEK